MGNRIDNNELKYRNFYVLGDSLSDTGGLPEILSHLSFARSVKFDEPFYQGRSFSNGPMAVEYVAKHLGFEEFQSGWKFSMFCTEYEQKGQNYSVSYAAASEISNPTYSYFFNKFRLANQLNALIEHHPDIGEEDLFLIMIGGNDVMFASTYDSSKAEEILEQAVSEICNALKTLSKHGVQHVIVANAPNIGLIPAFNKNEKAKEFATMLTNDFNKKLSDSLEDIKKKCTNLDIKKFDLDSKMKDMIDEYKGKGLNYEDACISDIADEIGGFAETAKILFKLVFEGKLEARYNHGCSQETLKDHLFFDYFHPTAEPHQKMGDELYELIKI
ncbi:SGNH/GDSL hydrolase family protein [Wolbachia endosymbiont of Folsomia candida]|uniref:SGNH/GDSL hydrolase family protein n=1 Tax=Wolbachia endosymbiont of Folsomia candida TaxID=169402 RepID=UPI000ACF5C16|nr:SGNH/GDSL hydrolase family protein [Wolbachia endosymbiont of Folsomia candida]APR98308.1 GDSL family lipase [Wolbachia endosymbiont of Folsomia candida]